MKTPNGLTPENINKVVTVSSKDLDTGITAYTTGTLESYSSVDGDWSIRLKGGLVYDPDDDIETTMVVHVKEPKIELARTRKPSHF